MKQDIILVIFAVALGLAVIGCQDQTAKNDPADCDLWLNQAPEEDFAYESDLSLPGRYPWCDALDTYYLSSAIWQYSDFSCTDHSPQLICFDTE